MKNIRVWNRFDRSYHVISLVPRPHPRISEAQSVIMLHRLLLLTHRICLGRSIARSVHLSILAEVLLWGCHLDVQSLLHQLLSAMVHYCGLLPVDQMAILQRMLRYSWLLQYPSSSRRHLGVPSVLSPVSVWSPQCRPGRSCRRTESPWLLDRCDEEALRQVVVGGGGGGGSPTFDFQWCVSWVVHGYK